jgi:nucleoside-diphosphate-sugar epimerase
VLKVLITGANGFIGSHIVDMLLKEKYNVTCILRKKSNLKWIQNLPIKYVYGDLDDKNFLETIINSVDIVIHCAGIVRAVTKNEYFKINVKNTRNLCQAILKININLKKFIFISSQAAMGPSSSCANIRKISDRESPISDYGLSKLAAESEIRKLFLKKVPYIILRPATVYGPRDKDVLIFFNLVYKHIRLLTTTKRLLQLVFVDDVAKAVINCLQNEKINNNTYYLANYNTYTWSDMGKIIASSARIRTIPFIIPDFMFKFAGVISEIFSYVLKKPMILNKQKIVEMLQKYWIADTRPTEIDMNIKFTSLEVGSRITYNWYLANRNFMK